MEYNPIAPFFEVSREMLFSGRLVSIYEALGIFGVSLILIVVAWTLYKLAMPILIERMEA
jgi:ABC-type polysaccharide/polyol phosphate export permease